MFHQQPKAITLQVRAGADIITMDGWESCYTLGIVKTGGSYMSVATMSGTVLIDGFTTLEEAHFFNRLMIDNPKFFAGTPTVEDMYKRSGGDKQFFAMLTETARKIQKRKAA